VPPLALIYAHLTGVPLQCDEIKPSCHQCNHYRIHCDFASPNQASSLVLGQEASIIFADSSTKIVQMLESDRTCIAPINVQMQSIMAELLAHYQSVACLSLGSPKAQKIMRTMVPNWAQEHPFLLHSILAFSARQLGYLIPQDPTYQVAAAHHQHFALQLYSKQLSQAISWDKVDALLAACMILTGLAFFGDDRISYILADPQEVSGWIAVTSGLGVLLHLENLKSYIPHSLWLPVIRDSDDDRDTYSKIRPGLDGLPAELVDLCHITGTSNKDNNPYHVPVRLLTAMMNLELDVHNFTKLIKFPCRLPSSFITLIRGKDPIALLLMSHWFALMSTMPHWWCCVRARFECLAICRHLKLHKDDRIQKLLEYPMRVCGYTENRLD
jgi:Fungal specific transcription factor domain